MGEGTLWNMGAWRGISSREVQGWETLHRAWGGLGGVLCLLSLCIWWQVEWDWKQRDFECGRLRMNKDFKKWTGGFLLLPWFQSLRLQATGPACRGEGTRGNQRIGFTSETWEGLSGTGLGGLLSWQVYVINITQLRRLSVSIWHSQKKEQLPLGTAGSAVGPWAVLRGSVLRRRGDRWREAATPQHLVWLHALCSPLSPPRALGRLHGGRGWRLLSFEPFLCHRRISKMRDRAQETGSRALVTLRQSQKETRHQIRFRNCPNEFT